MEESCKKCSGKTTDPRPARFRQDDRYSKYRRMYKEEMKNAMDV